MLSRWREHRRRHGALIDAIADVIFLASSAFAANQHQEGRSQADGDDLDAVINSCLKLAHDRWWLIQDALRSHRFTPLKEGARHAKARPLPSAEQKQVEYLVSFEQRLHKRFQQSGTP